MKEFSVSQLNNYIKNVFDDEYVLCNIQLQGEVVDFNVAKANTFFVLSDGICNISCIKFGACQSCEVGDTLSVVGTVKFYSKLGHVRFVANTICKVDKIGQKQRAFLELKDRLFKLGMLENKLPLPQNIKKIGLVTSKEGAVIYDFVSVARSRNSCVDIVVCPVRVQGDDSPAEIAESLRMLHDMTTRPDIVVLARGGGSSIDLDAFNHETTVFAVANSQIPVVSAIGHENDYTLCDLCASLRAGTPSIAAQMVVEDNNDLRNQTVDLLYKIVTLVENEFFRLYNRLTHLLQSIVYYSSSNISNLTRQIKSKLQQLMNFAQIKFDDSLNLLQSLSMQLEHSNPTKLLLQGYSKLQKDNSNVKSIGDVDLDDEIKVYLHDGSFEAKVLKCFKKNSKLTKRQ